MSRVTEEEMAHVESLINDEEISTKCKTATRAFLRDADEKVFLISLSMLRELIDEVRLSRHAASRLRGSFAQGILSEAPPQ
jgi:hypothetical protein